MKKSLGFLVILFCISSTFCQEQFAVYFNSDKFELTKAEISKLNDWIATHTNDKIVAINGYTDKDGSSGYNDTLAKKRVEHIFKLVSPKVPFRSDYKSRSFGEKFNQEKDKSKNRKVTIFYIKEIDLKRENEILGIKETSKNNELNPETVSIPITNLPDTAPLADRILNTKVGKTLVLKNINFYNNTFAVMNESRPILYDLAKIMHNNPKLVIQIQGHVCCNAEVTDSRSIMLSRERAKAIKMFLLSQKIPSTRVSFQGFGSSMPIFPIPEQDEEQRIANRRVEILIIDK